MWLGLSCAYIITKKLELAYSRRGVTKKSQTRPDYGLNCSVCQKYMVDLPLGVYHGALLVHHLVFKVVTYKKIAHVKYGGDLSADQKNKI